MTDKTHTCTSCGESWDENDIQNCNIPICPDCGNKLITIEEWIESKKED